MPRQRALDCSKNSTSDWTIAERGFSAQEPLRWRIDSNVISDLKHVEFRCVNHDE